MPLRKRRSSWSVNSRWMPLGKALLPSPTMIRNPISDFLACTIGSTAPLKFLDSQFQFCCWRCLFWGRDAEAMRKAVIVGKEKFRLAVVPMFEF